MLLGGVQEKFWERIAKRLRDHGLVGRLCRLHRTQPASEVRLKIGAKRQCEMLQQPLCDAAKLYIAMVSVEFPPHLLTVAFRLTMQVLVAVFSLAIRTTNCSISLQGQSDENVSFEVAKQVFCRHGGVLCTSEAIRFGIHPRTLYAMRDAGVLECLSRGLYRVSDLPPLGNPDLVAVALKVCAHMSGGKSDAALPGGTAVTQRRCPIIAVSVRQRLLNKARESSRPFKTNCCNTSPWSGSCIAYRSHLTRISSFSKGP